MNQQGLTGGGAADTDPREAIKLREVIKMSWEIRATGTADELRAAVHEHEVSRGGLLPETERLLAHHALGHALGIADKHPGRKFFLAGNGHESPETTRIEVWLEPLLPGE